MDLWRDWLISFSSHWGFIGILIKPNMEKATVDVEET